MRLISLVSHCGKWLLAALSHSRMSSPSMLVLPMQFHGARRAMEPAARALKTNGESQALRETARADLG